MRILDLSSPLNYNTLPASLGKIPRKYMIKFNPSIALYDSKNKIYLITYRTYVSVNRIGKPTRPKDPATPWWDGWFNNIYDGTGMALVKIRNNRIETLSDSIQKSGDWKQDMRVSTIPGKKHLMCYYTWIGNKNIHIGKNIPDRKFSPDVCTRRAWTDEEKAHFQEEQSKIKRIIASKRCVFMEKSNLKIRKRPFSYRFETKKVICPNYHNIIEKNWGFFIYNDKETFQYGLSPWNFLYYENSQMNKCNIIKPHNSDIFDKIQHYYQGSIHFSSSTPLKDLNKKELLGVYHTKIDYAKLYNMIQENKISSNSKLFEFIKILQKELDLPQLSKLRKWKHYENLTHDRYIYTMGYYTVNKKTLQLSRFSRSFLIRKDTGIIMFPSGLEHYGNNKYLITYGRDDIECKLMIISKKEIVEELKYTNSIFPQDYNTILVNYQFPKIKTKKLAMIVHPKPLDKILWTSSQPWIKWGKEDEIRMIDENFAQFDDTVVAFVKYTYPNIEVERIYADKVHLLNPKKYDMIAFITTTYVFLYDLYHYITPSLKPYWNKVLYILQSQQAYPNFKTNLTMDIKCLMYDVMKKNRIHIAPIFCFDLNKTSPSNITESIKKTGWDTVILKPSLGGESEGIEVIKNDNNLSENIHEYFDKYANFFDNIVAQKYIPSFVQNLESRNYYFGNNYAYTIFTNPTKTIIRLIKNKKEAKYHNLEKQYISSLRLSNKVMKIVQQFYAPDEPGFTRIDIGCCINGKVFFNELEISPGVFSGFLWKELPLVDALLGEQIVKVLYQR